MSEALRRLDPSTCWQEDRRGVHFTRSVLLQRCPRQQRQVIPIVVFITTIVIFITPIIINHQHGDHPDSTTTTSSCSWQATSKAAS